MTICKVGKTKSLMSVVNNYLIYTYQTDSEKYLPNYLVFARDVYSDLNFNILSSEIRKIFSIDKTLGTVKMPDDMLYWNQISVIDDDENVIPLLEKDGKLLPYEEEVVIPTCPNPACNSDLCSQVKAITAVQEVVTIDDEEYTNITKTQVLADGSLIKEICKWYKTLLSVNDYVITANGLSALATVHSIIINRIVYPIGLPASQFLNIEALLNALGLGTFDVTYTVDFPFVITSLENQNIIQSVLIGSTNYSAVVTNPQTIETVVKRCTTKQICKLELTEDECVADTPANVEVINQCCNTICCDTKKVLPTVQINDGIIYFSNNNFDKIVLTYKTSGINFGEELQVPEIALFVMISGIEYYALKLKRNTPESVKENARKRYNLDRAKFIKMFNPLRIQELEEVARIKSIIF